MEQTVRFPIHSNNESTVRGDETCYLNDFRVVYNRYKVSLLKYGNRFVTTEDAEELINDAFLFAWYKWQSFQNETHLDNYLHLIIHQHAVRRFKSTQRLAITTIDNAMNIVDNTDCRYSQREEELHQKTLVKVFFDAFTKLSPRCAQTVTYLLEGKRPNEIAAIMKIDAKTVYTNILVSRRIIVKEMKKSKTPLPSGCRKYLLF